MNFGPIETWLGLALILGIAELAAPGIFLVFVAIAAAITAATVWLVPGLPLVAQIVSTALWSVIAVMLGRRWYGNRPEKSSTRLNEPAVRLIGSQVIVETPLIASGEGRVRVGDGAWPARGPDAEVGTRLRVVGVESGVLIVDLIP